MRVKAVAVVAEVEGEPLEPSYVGECEGRSSHRAKWRVSPSSRAVSAKAKAIEVVAEVEGEPLEPSCIDEG